jgi:transcriptional regulator with XRE-family HTH domain
MGAVERGEQNLSLDSLEKIARGLGVSPSGLLGEAEREK